MDQIYFRVNIILRFAPIVSAHLKSVFLLLNKWKLIFCLMYVYLFNPLHAESTGYQFFLPYTVVFVGMQVCGVLFVFSWPVLKYKFCWYRGVYWVAYLNFFWMFLCE
jgi:hypothetical protein